MKISSVHGRQVLDSRGRPTVEVDISLENGVLGRATVPSGASKGSHEALEIRDGDLAKYGGYGVLKAIDTINSTIAPAVTGLTVDDQAQIDNRLLELDGTDNKGRLGANGMLGVSMAAAVAAAKNNGQFLYEYISALFEPDASQRESPSLPLPMVNVLSGGLHAGRQIDVQDFLFVPIGSSSYSEAMIKVSDVYRATTALLNKLGYEVNLVADEGGFGPKLSSNEEALELLTEAIETAGLDAGSTGAIAVDMAATHFYRGESYKLSSDEKAYRTEEMIELLANWSSRFPIISIEDGLAEDDWNGWKYLTMKLGNSVQILGDDLFATSHRRITRGIRESSANAVLIKVNQVGTLTETLDAIRLSKAHGLRTVVSARSGETEDTFIADLAVGTNAEQIKIGSITRSERLAKYNQLFRLEETIGSQSLATPFYSMHQ